MPAPSPIRILAPAKETGDLFGRLVSDLFLALGYDHPRLNIHKTGREIDVQAKHRTESRWVVAECKATAKPIGGADISKFVGVLDAERRKLGPTAGYFLSLSGFTEAAIEQERDFEDQPRVTLLDGRQIVEELVRGRIVVSPERALERAGRSAAREGTELIPEDRPQLLAHELGWVWAVRFRRNVEPTHVALVHADGELLSPALARQVLAADRNARGNLHKLACLAPEDQGQKDAERLAEARRAYFAYLAAECGEIELEGLPADQEVGSRRLRLENLFVSLHLESIPQEAAKKPDPDVPSGRRKRPARLTVGEALAKKARLAILAVPGGGKTTLLKRLAISYAFPERRTDLGDRLPDREWFPVLLRCRQIEDRATEPVISLLTGLGERAEMGENAGAFRGLLLASLREGRVLLLVDGLDEIADGGKRLAFVTQLRTFLSTYPGVDVVITSREAGFRIVAGALSAHCDHYRIADFDREDIERLTVAWHREVVGDRPEVESQARSLAATIWETDRVRRLAVNPLLLTTLLLVRRWVGQLPNRRSVLYEKAIEVLLWTWNVQGFEPLDIQEVIPQLAFLAWTMMEDEVQRISQPRLREVLQAARRQMPEVLAYARLSVSDFVERVELRSGLLVQSGHEVEDGRLVPLYEFRHLTFQEYLAAKALVEGYYPNRKEEDTLVSKLGPHLKQEAWREVVPLAAVLAGRKAIPLLEVLIGKALRSRRRLHKYEHQSDRRHVFLLSQCLLDEVQIPPGLVDKSLEAICRRGFPESRLDQLAASRHGERLREIAWETFSTSTNDLDDLGACVRILEHQKRGWKLEDYAAEQVEELLKSDVDRDQAVGLLDLALLAYRLDSSAERGDSTKISHLISYVKAAIHSAASWAQFGGAWALAWIAGREINDSLDPPDLRRLLDLWLTSNSEDIKYKVAWAFAMSAPIPRSMLGLRRLTEAEKSFLKASIDSESGFYVQLAGVLAAYYGHLYPDEVLVERALALGVHSFLDTFSSRRRHETTIRALLAQLGDSGKAGLDRLDQEKGRRTGSPV